MQFEGKEMFSSQKQFEIEIKMLLSHPRNTT